MIDDTKQATSSIFQMALILEFIHNDFIALPRKIKCPHINHVHPRSGQVFSGVILILLYCMHLCVNEFMNLKSINDF